MVTGHEESLRLFIHRGVSFCDIVLLGSERRLVASARWLYSKHRFKSQLEKVIKPWASQITNTVLLDEFADRLSGLRIGGSVAAVFPQGLETLTAQLHASPIHSESVVLVQPQEWSEAWKQETLEKLKAHSIKRIAWQCFVPQDVQDFFQTAGFENFPLIEKQLYSLQDWRRNLLNASCTGPVLELTEEVQAVLTNLSSTSQVQWLNENLQTTTTTQNRYELTSTWTHLVYLWAQKKFPKAKDLFVFDWDGCFTISTPQSQRWTPWGQVNCPSPLPSVHLLDLQPTQTLTQDTLGEWQWLGRADQFEPGPICLGRGLKPTVIDLLMPKEILISQFELKDVMQEKLHRQISSLFGLKHSDSVDNVKQQLKNLALETWADEVYVKAKSEEILLIGPLVEELLPRLQGSGFSQVHVQNHLPTMHDLHEVTPW